MDGPPPEGYGRWTGPLIARALGDVDVQHVWRFLRAQKIDLSGRKSWCESNDPEFAADIVGLYMALPENAIVICVDEKPSILFFAVTRYQYTIIQGTRMPGSWLLGLEKIATLRCPR